MVVGVGIIDVGIAAFDEEASWRSSRRRDSRDR
jgi:hypothetical protein